MHNHCITIYAVMTMTMLSKETAVEFSDNIVYSWTNSKTFRAVSSLLYCYVFTLLSSLKSMHNHCITIYAVMTMTMLSKETAVEFSDNIVYSWTNSKTFRAVSSLLYCYVFTLLSSLKSMHNHCVTIYAVMTLTIMLSKETAVDFSDNIHNI